MEGEKKNGEARTLHTGPPNLGGAAAPQVLTLTEHSGGGQESREAASATLKPPSGRRVARTRSANAQAGPSGLPAPSGSAPGRQTAPGANFAREEEAAQRIAGCVNTRGKERLPVHLPADKAVSPSLSRASAAPAHLTRAPRRRRGRRDGRYGTRPPLSRRVALGGGAGRARRAGGRSCSADWPRGRGRIRAGRKQSPDPI